MNKLLCKEDYLKEIAGSRDRRMAWWREARLGMFVHFGLYSQLGRHEWAMVYENFPKEKYQQLADSFSPKPGAPREWAKLAKRAGMKYMVLTTRHHEGFSLWDSKVNAFNAVNYGPKRDIVREYVDACREFGLRIGFYSSLMDWSHPDAGRAAYDSEARVRFNRYIEDLNTELLTNYGKIDILWFDVSWPMEHFEGWNSLEMNQHLRALQPDILINNRSKLPEDFSTPEERIRSAEEDWEACMTFNGISWGYIDSEQARPYSFSAQQILRMVNTCSRQGGNLLLNIGPKPDGSVPSEAVEPLSTVGNWLQQNGRAVYGQMTRASDHRCVGASDMTQSGNSVFVWHWIWPECGSFHLGGFMKAPREVKFLNNGTSIEFEHDGRSILLKNLPKKSVDPIANIPVIELVFDSDPQYVFSNRFPQLHHGKEYNVNS